jgi:hypothetical protein
MQPRTSAIHWRALRGWAMKGVFTLGIYIAIGITGAAFGQVPVKTSKERVISPTPIGFAVPVPSTFSQNLKPPAERVVMKWGAGGRVVDHRLTFEEYFKAGTKVELRGPCYSACTLILGYPERANLCIAPGAFMAFHAVRGEKYKAYMPAETRAMVESFPPEVRRWIERNGGWEKLPIDGFWTMYDRELWAMGYPKCE